MGEPAARQCRPTSLSSGRKLQNQLSPYQLGQLRQKLRQQSKFSLREPSREAKAKSEGRRREAPHYSAESNSLPERQNIASVCGAREAVDAGKPGAGGSPSTQKPVAPGTPSGEQLANSRIREIVICEQERSGDGRQELADRRQVRRILQLRPGLSVRNHGRPDLWRLHRSGRIQDRQGPLRGCAARRPGRGRHLLFPAGASSRPRRLSADSRRARRRGSARTPCSTSSPARTSRSARCSRSSRSASRR